ncbi:MoxR family ATPase [Schaalia sp. 19OD2882]|uniref:AAA family ATPase n=1 Tax=Schaalia sp. 19OD2882 TaxID=2794089 RepID=UPI0020A6DD2E|nr:AAA family ATPase [Schaalia sp. 19OD2882]
MSADLEGAVGSGTAADAAGLASRLCAAVGTVLVGKDEAVATAVCTLLAGGHLLLEDVPGVGKTSLALALAGASGATSQRIQFTSDMLPTDVTGVSVYDQVEQRFRFHPGPVFAHVVLADEINRATPKTQSALLEAMGEGHVSVDGRTMALPDPFMVVATQNPVDMEGTFHLPEAQRDRFMARLSLGYPDQVAEARMVGERNGSDPMRALHPVAQVADLVRARAVVASTHMAPGVVAYAVALSAATRRHPGLALGASPRATLHVAAMARARAAMGGRDHVKPDDVARVAPIVLGHRVVPAGRHASAAAARQVAAEVIADVLATTPVEGR